MARAVNIQDDAVAARTTATCEPSVSPATAACSVSLPKPLLPISTKSMVHSDVQDLHHAENVACPSQCNTHDGSHCKPTLLLPGLALHRRVSEIARAQPKEECAAPSPVVCGPIARKRSTRLERGVSFHEEVEWLSWDVGGFAVEIREFRPLGVERENAGCVKLEPEGNLLCCDIERNLGSESPSGGRSPHTTRHQDCSQSVGFGFGFGFPDEDDQHSTGSSSLGQVSPKTPRQSSVSSPPSFAERALHVPVDSPKVGRHRNFVDSRDLPDKESRFDAFCADSPPRSRSPVSSRQQGYSSALEGDFGAKESICEAKGPQNPRPLGTCSPSSKRQDDALSLGLSFAIACGGT